jgi:capsular exopolysaccharide synthesis family protein
VLARVPVGNDEETIEAFRGLRTTLMFLDTTTPMRTVAVVSSNPSAGKTFTCLHLARSVAALQISAVLIDGDMRRPVLHRQAGVGRSPGLGDLLKGAPLQSALHPSPGDDGLHLIPGGTPVEDPAGMLASRAFRDILAQLDGAGLVVVDTPACDFFADGLAIASQCDATIVVIDAEGTRRRSVRRLIHQLRRMGSNPIGIVINRAEGRPRGYYYYRQERRPAAAGS